MKPDIHPKYEETTVTCACGATYTFGTTKKYSRIEVCSNCHPLFTGQQKLIDSGGRVERFKKRYGLS